MNKNYDLAVIGGGTAGCAAAYIAAKSGLKTLLVEKNIHLGGTITSGLVVPVMFSGENQINTEFYDTLIDNMHSLGGQITYQNNRGWFNPELLKPVLDEMMSEVSVDVLFSTSVSSINIKDRSIKSIHLTNNMLSVYNYSIENGNKILSVPIDTRYVIDATGNCEIGKLCGCSFLDLENENQPVTLRFIMDNVDIKSFSEWLYEYDKDRNVTTVENIDGNIHLSTAYTWDTDKNWALRPLFDNAVKEGVLEDADRNYFQIFSVAGMPNAIAFNCPRYHEIIDLKDNFELSKALISLRKSILRIADFCKKTFPGFGNAYISNIADTLGIRVSNRIKGKYVYTYDDLKSGKTFENPVLISNYPVDIHSADKNTSTLKSVCEYSLPIESLMSADIDNLFVVGRCLSADFTTQSALRVQSSCFSMGEGAAKYIASLIRKG